MASSAPNVFLPSQRREQILDLLGSEGSVRVAPLARQFAVAEETIRRDLDKLEVAGRLLRTHGGAVQVRDAAGDKPLAVRKITNVQQKKAIARRAAALVTAGDTLALDASSTVFELAQALPDIPLTVVTNSLDTAQLLQTRQHVGVTLTGGQLDCTSLCLLGPITELTLRQFSFDKAFLSCTAVDTLGRLAEASVAHASLKRWMLELAERSYLLVDHSKFDMRSVSVFGKLSDVDAVVTDERARSARLDTAVASGATVHHVA